MHLSLGIDRKLEGQKGLDSLILGFRVCRVESKARQRGGAFKHVCVSKQFRRTQEGCGGLGGENPAAFPQARPIFQQPFSLPESAQTLAGIAFRAAGKSGNHFPAASKFAGKPFQQRISDSHSLLEFSEQSRPKKTPKHEDFTKNLMPESIFSRGLQPPKFFVFLLCFSLKYRENANTKNFEGGQGGQKK